MEKAQQDASRQDKAKRRWLIAIAAIVASFLIVIPGIMMAISNHNSYGRNTSTEDAVTLRYSDLDPAANPREEVTFPSGGAQLQGYIFPAQGVDKPVGLEVFVHGLNSDADTMLPLVTYYQQRGWTCFSFDCTGSGKSGGDAVRGLCQHRFDLEAALSSASSRDDLGSMPTVLIGHSMGGHAVTSAFADDIADAMDIRAVVALSAFDSANETTDVLLSTYMGPSSLLFVPHVWMQNYLAFGSASETTAIDGINATDTPFICVYGTEDEAVPPFKSGIPAHASQITNPNVQLVEVSEEPRNTHSALWFTADTARYVQDLWSERDTLRKEYGTPLTGGVYQNLLAHVDKQRASQTDPALMGRIEAFCREKVS